MAGNVISVVAAKVAPVYAHKCEIFPGKLAVTVTAGQTLYQTPAGDYALCEADVAAAAQLRGMALEGGVADQVISILKEGHVYGVTLTSQSPDDIVYVGEYAGGLYDAALTGGGTRYTVPAGRVAVIPDGTPEKVLYFSADWSKDYAVST